MFDTEVSDAPVYDTVLDTERFLIQSYQLNKVHIVQCNELQFLVIRDAVETHSTRKASLLSLVATIKLFLRL